MSKISVIVPVYKVEAFLAECIESIIAQSFQDLEVILVDDGSPDNCGQICDEYAKKDSRIRVVHKQNGGLSSTRNAGLDVATGEYVGFVDSDDFIHPQMYEIMHHYAQTDGSDIVCTYLTKQDIREQQFEVTSACPERLIVDTNTALRNFTRYRAIIRDTAPTKLYNRHIFDELRFREGIIYEDAHLLPYILQKAKQVTALQGLYLYCYRVNPESITHSVYSADHLCSVFYNRSHIEFFHAMQIPKQRDAMVLPYIDAVIRNDQAVRSERRDLMPQLEEVLQEYKKFRKWILKNCQLCKAYRILLKLFPACRPLARWLLDYLVRGE